MKRTGTILFLFLIGALSLDVRAQSFNPAIGLEAHYKLDANGANAVGNGKNGTVNGAADTTDRNGVANGAMAFNGSSYIQIEGPLFGGNQVSAFTINVHVNVSSFTGEPLIWSKAYFWGEVVLHVTADKRIRFFWANTATGNKYSTIQTAANTLALNEWTAITIRFQNSTLEVFKNGQKLAGEMSWVSQGGSILSTTQVEATANFAENEGTNKIGQNFVGSVDELRFYNYALSDSDVAALYAYEENPQEEPDVDYDSSLAAYYPFNGNALDQSGNGRNGTTIDVESVTDRLGNEQSAFRFNGSTSKIQLGNWFNYQSFTISLWVKAEAQTNGISVLIDNNHSHSYNWVLQSFSNNNEYFWGTSNQAVTLPENEWANLVIAHANNTSKLFLDGGFIGQSNFAIDYGLTPNLNLGYWVVDDARYWKGSLDDIRIYNRALSDAEVAALYELESTPPNLSTDTWSMPVKAALDGFDATATVGVSTEATDGFDVTLDGPEPPGASGSYVRAFFHRPEWNGLLTDAYLADIRASTDLSAVPKSWTLSVETNLTGSGTLLLDRPAGMGWPIVVMRNGQTWVSRSGDLSIPFTATGALTSLEYIIQVGDTTAPSLSAGALLNGPRIWDHTQNRNLEWDASDANHLTGVKLEFSSNGGESWSELYSGLNETFDFDVPSFVFNENALFRLTATDRALNVSTWTTTDAISIVAPKQPRPFTAGWHMLGAPFSEVSAANSFYDSGFRYGWDGRRYAAVSSYAAGRGYWLGAYEAGADTLTGTVAETTQALKIYSGWHMMTNPLLRSVYSDSISVTRLLDGNTVPFAAAVDSGWVTPLLTYEEAAYAQKSSVEPFTGYWVGVVADSVQLNLPIHKYGMSVSKTTTPEILAVVLNIQDGKNTGRLSIGTTGISDLPAPPAAPNAQLIGLKGTKTILGDVYLNRKIASESQMQTALSAAGSVRTISLSWDNQTVSGMEFQLVFANGRTFDLTKSGTAVWNTAEPAPVVESGPVTTSNESGKTIPQAIALHQNYPNPFNPSTQIRFDLPAAGNVTLKVYSVVGQEIATLVNGTKAAGSHVITFDASKLANGVYVYRLQAGNTALSKKMVLLK
jgi:hypothetical protein